MGSVAVSTGQRFEPGTGGAYVGGDGTALFPSRSGVWFGASGGVADSVGSLTQATCGVCGSTVRWSSLHLGPAVGLVWRGRSVGLSATLVPQYELERIVQTGPSSVTWPSQFVARLELAAEALTSSGVAFGVRLVGILGPAPQGGVGVAVSFALWR
jgi:hypothetical protein